MPLYKLTDADDIFPTAPQDNSGDDTILGLGGDDKIDAGRGANVVSGGAGNDTVSAQGSKDQQFFGRDGDDFLRSNGGDDLLDGGFGNDTLLDGGGDNTLRGGAGDDILSFRNFGGPKPTLNFGYGGEGNDVVRNVSSGTAQLYGGVGDDTVGSVLDGKSLGVSGLFGGDGLDRLLLDISQTTVDTVTAPHLVTMVQSGDHVDFLLDGTIRAQAFGFETWSVTVSVDNATLFGGTGQDEFTFGDGSRTGVFGGQVTAGDGDDQVAIHSWTGAFVLDGGAGSDLLMLDYGALPAETPQNVSVDMTTANGTLDIGGAHSTLTGFEVLNFAGGSGNDMVHAGSGDDTIGGFYNVATGKGDRDAGNDSYDGAGGNDLLYGGRGFDTLIGGEGDDSMEGGEAGDKLYGGIGADMLVGDSSRFLGAPGGRDLLFGGTGDDVLIGGSGSDTMSGGNGADVFVFEKISDSGVRAADQDKIKFFTVLASETRHADQIDLHLIDGNTATGFNNSLQFIGQAAFTEVGQVRVQEKNGNAYIQINNGGTLDADMVICLVKFDGALLGAEDFIL